MNTQVDKKIDDLRSYLGLSLRALSEQIGYTGTHILRIEQKAVNPSEQFIQKVCEGLHVDPEYFTGEMPVEQAVQKVEVDTAGAGQRLKTARVDRGLSMWELSRRDGMKT